MKLILELFLQQIYRWMNSSSFSFSGGYCSPKTKKLKKGTFNPFIKEFIRNCYKYSFFTIETFKQNLNEKRCQMTWQVPTSWKTGEFRLTSVDLAYFVVKNKHWNEYLWQKIFQEIRNWTAICPKIQYKEKIRRMP